MQWGWTKQAASWRWLTAFAFVALLVQAFVPQGYMVSSVGGAPGITICTGHGPLVLSHDHGQPAKPTKPGHEAPCAFAGHGVGVAPSAALAVGDIGLAFFAAAAVASVHDLLPGRGLAAPPPPSQGPPALSV
ncbi:MAG TPA: hypothetical protein VMT68_17715 [Caulobacteraceae bacterium]|nr:hypothetical protein [Caulobacteraceae bacterium]